MMGLNSLNEYNATDFSKIKGGVYPLMINDIAFLSKYVIGNDMHDDPSKYTAYLKTQLGADLAETFNRSAVVGSLGTVGESISSFSIPMYSFSGDVRNVTTLKGSPTAGFNVILDFSQVNDDNTSFDYTLIFDGANITTTRKLIELITIGNTPQTVYFTQHCNVDTISTGCPIAVNVKKTALGAMVDVQKLLMVTQS